MAVALLLLAGSPVSAATLFSPPIVGGGPTEGFVCLVLNTGKQPLKPSIAEVREDGGGVLSSSAPLDGLAPGAIARIATLASITERTVYCVVEGKVSRKSVRMTLCLSGVPPYNCVTGP